MKTRFLDGWPLLGSLSLVLLVMSGVFLASQGGDVAGVRAVIRLTARTSLFLFALAFSARAMATLWPCSLTQWQRRNRRQLGLAFAVSHTLHAVAIVTFARMDPAEGHGCYACRRFRRAASRAARPQPSLRCRRE